MKTWIAAAAVCTVLLPAAAGAFELSSPEVAEGTRMPEAHVLAGFGCRGDNRSPALSWSDPPAGAKSFALTVYDPDAPTGSGFWHWVVLDIPAAARTLAAGAGTPRTATITDGSRQLRSDFGSLGYGGPCPPKGHGMHRYVFTLHALDVERLPAPDDASAALAGFVINAHSLATAKLTAVYWR